jgi:hypothetical protein
MATSQRIRFLTEEQFAFEAETHPDEERITKRCIQIREAGGRPQIKHSDFNGYWVVNLDAMPPRGR